MQIDTVLFAAGRASSSLVTKTGVEIKALIELNDKTLLEHGIDALRGSCRTGKIFLVGPEAVLGHPAAESCDVALPASDGNSIHDSIVIALDSLTGSGQFLAEHTLIITADLPFVSAEAVNAFLDGCSEDSEICVPVVTKRGFEARFPGAPAGFVRLKDGEVTLGCAFLLKSDLLSRRKRELEHVFEATKSQAGIARLLGPGVVFKYLTGRLTLEDIEDQCGKILDCNGQCVRGAPPELAFDVDTEADFDYASTAPR
jgi:molybdopterin-guanine dinucleotide biosynthesis protein A